MDNEGVKVYSQMVDHMDVSVGKVRAALAAKGIDDETLVIFTSDNGAARDFGDSGGLRGNKGSIHEGGMRVPGLAVWPGVLPADVKSEFPVFVQNWAPTLLEAAGVKAADNAFTGTSAWQGLIGNSDSKLPGTTLVGSVEGTAVFEWPYKMIRKVERGPNPCPAVQELYNVVADPFETNELTESEPVLVARLAKALDGQTVMPSLNDVGPSPAELYRNADGTTNYNIRVKETTPPWAERAKGNQGH